MYVLRYSSKFIWIRIFLYSHFSCSGRAVSVYNSGKGFIIKIHDQLGFKFRCSHYNGQCRKYLYLDGQKYLIYNIYVQGRGR